MLKANPCNKINQRHKAKTQRLLWLQSSMTSTTLSLYWADSHSYNFENETKVVVKFIKCRHLFSYEKKCGDKS